MAVLLEQLFVKQGQCQSHCVPSNFSLMMFLQCRKKRHHIFCRFVCA